MTDTQGDPISPLPLQIGLAQVQGIDGNPLVLLQVATVYGTLTLPLDGKAARDLGAQMQRLGAAAATGLLLAGAS